jgi:hypothetical protein
LLPLRCLVPSLPISQSGVTLYPYLASHRAFVAASARSLRSPKASGRG